MRCERRIGGAASTGLLDGAGGYAAGLPCQSARHLFDRVTGDARQDYTAAAHCRADFDVRA